MYKKNPDDSYTEHDKNLAELMWEAQNKYLEDLAKRFDNRLVGMMLEHNMDILRENVSHAMHNKPASWDYIDEKVIRMSRRLQEMRRYPNLLR